MKSSLFVFCLFILVSWNSFSATSCESFTNPSVRKIRINTASYPLVRQCGGSCYFETAVAALENLISVSNNRQLSIHRPALFYELVLARLSWWVEFLGDADPARVESWMKRKDKQEFDYFLIDGGTIAEALQLASRRGVWVLEGWEPRRQQDNFVTMETALMEVRQLFEKFRSSELSFREMLEAVESMSQERLAHYRSLLEGRFLQKVVPMVRTVHIYTVSPRLWHRQVIDNLENGRGLSLTMKTDYFREFLPDHADRTDPPSIYEYFVGPRREDEGHGAFIVGANTNSAGTRVIELIIRNSWGAMDGEFVVPVEAILGRRHSLSVLDWSISGEF